MATAVNLNDPRVKRTRLLLLKSFTALLEERQNIHSISVQDIAERATVNRTTFYAHFEDKYALLESWIRNKFQRAIESQLAASNTLQADTLQMLILAVFDFLSRFRLRLKPSDSQFEPLFEVAIQQELYEVFLTRLKQISEEIPVAQETIEITALVMSWAIFGPAAHWSRGNRAISMEEMVNQVFRVVLAGLAPVFIIR